MNIISSAVIGVMVMVIVVIMAVTRGVVVVNVYSRARMLRRFWKQGPVMTHVSVRKQSDRDAGASMRQLIQWT